MGEADLAAGDKRGPTESPDLIEQIIDRATVALWNGLDRMSFDLAPRSLGLVIVDMPLADKSRDVRVHVTEATTLKSA